MTMRSLKDAFKSALKVFDKGQAAVPSHAHYISGKGMVKDRWTTWERTDVLRIGKNIYRVSVYPSGAAYLSTYIDTVETLIPSNDVWLELTTNTPEVLDAIVMWVEHDDFAGLNLDEFVKKVLSGN